ncbi:pentapeptide repeat-containing protein [Amycolatopsis sp. lyj-84]|uniref:pentapeptide repeat-containing protein n=1 Tax=Amycolatopsis sp. lyj-84 TaxID=2789284 RepID=UPI00397DA309
MRGATGPGALFCVRKVAMGEAWAACGLEGCRGVRIGDFDRCLAHLHPTHQDRYFDGLAAGSDVHLSGTTLSGDLLRRLIGAVGRRFGWADFGEVRFESTVQFEAVSFDTGASFHKAVFLDSAWFEGVRFPDATFEGAEFVGDVRFDRASFRTVPFKDVTFHRHARFDGAAFDERADFQGTAFGGRTSFRAVVFGGEAWFVTDGGFTGDARFDEAHFHGRANFDMQVFKGAANFGRAKFEADARFEGARFLGRAGFENAEFGGEATFREAAASEVASFAGADFQATEYFGPITAKTLNLGHATFGKRVSIEADVREMDCAETTFEGGVSLAVSRGALDLDRVVFGKPSTVIAASGASVTSISGTDVADLVLTDVDLARCEFAGAHHLDKLRLEGDCRFATRRRRQVLAEEQAWRRDRNAPVGPRRIADLYRQLRKAQEDSKNEPGAADFYYGEMEMRRHSPATPWSERFILHLYWLISGYGLRALRALTTLAVLVVLASVGFRLGGFKTTPAFGDTLIYVAQSTVSLETKLTSLPKELTPFGEVVRLVMRVLGPLLLGLTLLAVRNRVKR